MRKTTTLYTSIRRASVKLAVTWIIIQIVLSFDFLGILTKIIYNSIYKTDMVPTQRLLLSSAFSSTFPFSHIHGVKGNKRNLNKDTKFTKICLLIIDGIPLFHRVIVRTYQKILMLLNILYWEHTKRWLESEYVVYVNDIIPNLRYHRFRPIQ